MAPPAAQARYLRLCYLAGVLLTFELDSQQSTSNRSSSTAVTTKTSPPSPHQLLSFFSSCQVVTLGVDG
ncbi:hypothetical protein PF005_g22078 [Phytophthora fragariae]|uniref:Secreted protein n=1 Tax=Phytophthora fragariae TaxID=53985 RepID=A0A6A3X3P3_9STRA|nr:hypothetical protein PF003_g15898 [Phytophthora fragariae]KAE8936592.1 hypothetical protein PF009_g13478 [Phytophthora fragariae]KAE8984648.1 hypothetical protein PF011_g20699 [Phytophthora fragariae]KAE9082847.1 hypothetical protein PF007_g22145 [Phytophthora fragariae]KAE9083127.1 hypothetical protein PF010_g21324 [Phytophthora fragariae]